MATLTISSSQKDVELGEKVSLIATVSDATPGSTIMVDISTAGQHWPGTLHVNSKGSGGCISSDVVLPGKPGQVTLVTLVASSTSSAGDVIADSATSVRVHG